MNKFISRIIKSDGQFFILASLINKFSSFIIAIVLSRNLSLEGYSYISLLMSYVAILAPIMSLGANQAILRNATLITNSLARLSYILRKFKIILIFYIFSFLSLVAFMFFIKDIETRTFIFLIASYVLLSSISNFILSAFRVIGGNRSYSKLLSLTTLTTLFILIITISEFKELSYPIALVLSQFFILFLLVFKSIQYSRSLKEGGSDRRCIVKSSKNKSDNKSFFIYGSSIVLANFGSQLSLNIDILMLDYFEFSNVLSIYRNASILIVSLLFISAVLVSNQYLEIVKTSHSVEGLKNFYFDYAKFAGPLVITIVFILYFFGDFLMVFAFGDAYSDSYEVLLILSLTLIPNFMIRTPVGNILAALGKSYHNVTLSLFSVVINVMFNSYAVPNYGLVGAAWSTVLAMYISSLLYLIILRSIKHEKNQCEL